EEARSGDGRRRDAALGSGAQLISTDYPEPDPRFGTGYAVELSDHMVARCNPVRRPACRIDE
ncbi:MAG TPA: Ca2+-dependent phosphoinositide-specific phospholipase C, partial [Polyangiaceae bacterium]|nr:Ca2+-dependent phosphoinositide-specific phospholipase C [Polyangiaceae bacterium]